MVKLEKLHANFFVVYGAPLEKSKEQQMSHGTIFMASYTNETSKTFHNSVYIYPYSAIYGRGKILTDGFYSNI